MEMLDSMGAFPWDDPDQDQRPEITRIADPDPDRLKGTHPCILSLLLTVALPLNIRALQ